MKNLDDSTARIDERHHHQLERVVADEHTGSAANRRMQPSRDRVNVLDRQRVADGDLHVCGQRSRELRVGIAAILREDHARPETVRLPELQQVGDNRQHAADLARQNVRDLGPVGHQSPGRHAHTAAIQPSAHCGNG